MIKLIDILLLSRKSTTFVVYFENHLFKKTKIGKIVINDKILFYPFEIAENDFITLSKSANVTKIKKNHSIFEITIDRF